MLGAPGARNVGHPRKESGVAQERRSAAPAPRNGFLAAAFGLAGVVLVVHARSYDFIADDAFIALRYVRNLVEGQGLVYNPRERVEGYTCLLWVLLLALPGAAGFDLLSASRVLSMAGALGVLVITGLLARRLAPGRAWPSAVAALLVAVNAPFACWALAGMEGPVFALSVAASLLLALRAGESPRRRLAAGVACGAAALVRPEGVLVGLVLCAFEALRAAPENRWKRTALLAGPFAGLVAAQLGWRLHYYGDWLPNTYYAKVGSGSVALSLRGVSYLADYAREYGGLLATVLPLAAGAWRRDREWWTVATVLTALAAGVVYVGGDGLPMYRFIVPIVPLWAVLVASFASDAVRAATTRPVRVAVIVALGLVASSEALPATRGKQYLLYRAQKEYEVPVWTATGKWLRENASPSESVACVPIGAIGYYSGLVIHDMLGLTNRHIAKLDRPTGGRWAGHEKHDGAYILSLEPNYLLLGNVRVLDRALPLHHPLFVRDPSIEDRESE